MKLLLLSLILAGCGGIEIRKPCTGASGMQYMGPDTDNWDCSHFVNAEAVIIPKLVKDIQADKRFQTIDLKRYKLYIHPESSFIDSDRRVAGVTYCWHEYIIISNKAWQDSALAHEIAHAVQDCTPQGPDDGQNDIDHMNWDKDGITRATNQFWNINVTPGDN